MLDLVLGCYVTVGRSVLVGSGVVEVCVEVVPVVLAESGVVESLLNGG